uniref:HORMA domain-containing protein n=1 Tax=Heterorhabditis bacteriophora TaxID=37862 RepID=A0A1I7X1Z5_HETBA
MSRGRGVGFSSPGPGFVGGRARANNVYPNAGYDDYRSGYGGGYDMYGGGSGYSDYNYGMGGGGYGDYNNGGGFNQGGYGGGYGNGSSGYGGGSFSGGRGGFRGGRGGPRGGAGLVDLALSTMGDEKVIQTGLRRRKLKEEICKMLSEYMYIVAHTVLYKFGGYSRENFDSRPYGSVLIAKICRDENVISYCQRSVHLASKTMEQNDLDQFEGSRRLGFEIDHLKSYCKLTYSVCIVDSCEESLIAFRIAIRKSPNFRNRAIHINDTNLECFQSALTTSLSNLQNFAISEKLKNKLAETPTRLRIRLLLCTEDPQRNFQSSVPPPLAHSLIPWGDAIHNDFNEVSFMALIPDES